MKDEVYRICPSAVRLENFWCDLSRVVFLLYFISGVVLVPPRATAGAATTLKPIQLVTNEYWWGGWSVEGIRMPYDADTRFARDLSDGNGQNQAQPFLLSSCGRYVWSEKPFKFEFDSSVLRITQIHGVIHQIQAGTSLREAFQDAAKRFFPADGKMPDPLMFTRPQYNTWIELGLHQSQEKILGYAQAIKAQGYPPGVLMLDDTWQEAYGNWTFSARHFPDPKAMMDELHALGFKVMVWVCPFVSPDTQNFRDLEAKELLLKDSTPMAVAEAKMWIGKTAPAALIRWWDGVSGCLDFSNPKACAWFKSQLDILVRDYGVDGFKFDAADAVFYPARVVSHVATLPNEHAELYAQFGLDYPLNEYRAAWKMAGRSLAQRLQDKAHKWEDLQQLIPDTLAQGLMGYAFTCPDMIGGGLLDSFLSSATIDQELMVRSAQVHALMPMMQFSAAPWRVLDAEHNTLCRRAAELHTQHADTILALARHAADTGVPIVRPLCWHWPNRGYEKIKDQFMLGDDILVAPIVVKGGYSRTVVFPPGLWRGDDNSIVQGPTTMEILVPLDRLPRFHHE